MGSAVFTSIEIVKLLFIGLQGIGTCSFDKKTSLSYITLIRKRSVWILPSIFGGNDR